MNYSPQWQPEGITHRTDASSAAPPWLLDRLGSEHCYRVTYHRHGSHDESVVTVYIVSSEHGYSLLTTFELFDITGSKHHPKERKLTQQHHTEDRIFFGDEFEARTSAVIEATLHQAHTRRFNIGTHERADQEL